MKKILILGYGSPLRGDDALGSMATEQLQTLWKDHDSVDTEIVHQLTPEVIETLIQYDVVVLIDASANGPPGQVQVREIAPPSSSDAPLHHHCTPENLLCMAQQFYAYAPRTLLFSIAGKDFGYSESLSREVELVLPSLVKDVNQFLFRELDPSNSSYSKYTSSI